MTMPQQTREFHQKLFTWLAAQNPKVNVEDLRPDTNLIKEKIISSMQVMDLILFIENLRGDEPIDPASLKPQAFESVDAICSSFLNGEGS